MTDMRWAPLVGATVITVKAWDKIPVAARPAVMKAAAEAGVRFKDEIRNGEQKAVDTMKEHGLVVHQITPDQYDQWEKLFTSVYPQISGTVIPKDMMDMAMQYRDEYRSSHKASAEK